MTVEVTVLRVFTDAHGRFGNPLGVVDAGAVAASDRQRIAAELGYSETVFVDLPEPGSDTTGVRIFTPATELRFAGHPTVGAAWWLRERGTPVRALQAPAGPVTVAHLGDRTAVTARPDWSPRFALHELGSIAELTAASPADYSGDVAHYLWTWLDRDTGELRARMFAPNLGVAEDEATGSAAIRMTDHLGRDLTITQGRGSQIVTAQNPDGSVRVAGRVVDDGPRRLG